ncbi:glucose 1-dehydrogenase [Vallitalea okinawensis]|uniref:glucose 1-dehydrogenase n=1 Tax=Vallitalea okinawensis TaxID=2078660 RepID=UPI000CFC4799|nr:glucose 1-dehydrogenase [Vallitalea okinawensis]
MKYKNKVVVVTGAGQGIGACVARKYAGEGAIVMLIDLDKEAGLENKAYIEEAGYACMFFQGDVSNENDMIDIFTKIGQQYNKIDILINNAAVGDSGSICDRSIEEWNRVIAVNLTGPYIVSKQAVLHMVDGGSIINLCSTRALMSEPHTEPYTASKGGLLALTHSLAVSLGPRVRVNAISPGWIDVSQWKKIRERKFTHISEEEHLQHPAGRVGKPEDIAAACMFLTSHEAEFITGTNLVIDGGMSVKMIYE